MTLTGGGGAWLPRPVQPAEAWHSNWLSGPDAVQQPPGALVPGCASARQFQTEHAGLAQQSEPFSPALEIGWPLGPVGVLLNPQHS